MQESCHINNLSNKYMNKLYTNVATHAISSLFRILFMCPLAKIRDPKINRSNTTPSGKGLYIIYTSPEVDGI